MSPVTSRALGAAVRFMLSPPTPYPAAHTADSFLLREGIKCATPAR